MKKLKTLEVIKELINAKDVEFIPVKEADMIHIDYKNSCKDLYVAYNASIKISKLFDTKVNFRFNGCDILVDKNTKMKDVATQYGKEHKIDYVCYVEKEFAKAIKNLNVKNAKRKTKEVLRLIKDKKGFRKYIRNYQMNKLSSALTNAYKIALPDPYLDSMVEKAKVLKKTKV